MAQTDQEELQEEDAEEADADLEREVGVEHVRRGRAERRGGGGDADGAEADGDLIHRREARLRRPDVHHDDLGGVWPGLSPRGCATD